MVAEDQLAPRPAPPRDTALSPSSLPLPADESPSPPPGAAAYRVPVDVASAVVALRSPGAKVGGLSVLIQRCRLHCIRSTRGSCTNTPALLAVTMHSGRTLSADAYTLVGNSGASRRMHVLVGSQGGRRLGVWLASAPPGAAAGRVTPAGGAAAAQPSCQEALFTRHGSVSRWCSCCSPLVATRPTRPRGSNTPLR